jgi:hypothetical protein
MCADGTPNGYTIMHFDGIKYLLDYRAARRGADEQIRITAPEVVPTSDVAKTEFRANVCNAIPGATIEWRIQGGEWQPMIKTENETDPTFQTLYNEEQTFLPGKPAWRPLAKPMVCPHLWKATLVESMKSGTHLIQVRATNPNGQILSGERIIRIE